MDDRPTQPDSLPPPAPRGARAPSIDRVFAALASPARRRMLDILQERPGLPIAALAERFRMSGVGVLKHVRVLERAGLVISRRSGRARLLYFNAVPIQMIYDRWTDRYSGFWSARLADLKDRIEAGAARDAGTGPDAKRKVVQSA